MTMVHTPDTQFTNHARTQFDDMNNVIKSMCTYTHIYTRIRSHTHTAFEWRVLEKELSSHSTRAMIPREGDDREDRRGAVQAGGVGR